MENTHRITTLSRRMKFICIGLIFCLPVICALFWIFFNYLYSVTGSMIPLPVRLDHDLATNSRFLAFLSTIPQLGVTIYGLWKLKELFALYEKSSIFTEENVNCFKSLGKALIAWVICDVAGNALLSMALTINNPPGQSVIVVGLNSGDFTGMFVGAVVLIISRVMDEARKIQDEQALII